MALAPGTRLGPYEVGAQIGAGGMGEVYRATDTNLKRAVALKVLPASVASDPDRLARFQREAEVLASLNHPHIAAVHGLERSAGITALVMELVEGPTLADRIEQGALPVDEALPIAMQIADALAAAHDRGIVHRDLKPANVKVRADGTVKVLDFGLAKAMDPAAAQSGSASMMPTVTTPAHLRQGSGGQAMTQAGVVLGTAAYMSPEQAKGRAVDARTDIWAFGATLYEMLTGRRAFGGDDVADTLANVLKSEPDWSALPGELGPVRAAYLKRCLAKDATQRIHHIADVRLALQGAFDVQGPEAVAAAPPRARLAWTLAGVALIVAAGLAIPATRHVTEPPAARPRAHVSLALDQGIAPTFLALSPDGRWLAVSHMGRLQLRSIETGEIRPLPGSQDGRTPFWSTDSRSVAFFAEGKLKMASVSGGPAQVVCENTGLGMSGTRNAAGTILLATSTTRLMRVQPGGRCEELPKLSGSVPVFLPDGDHFFHVVSGSDERQGLYVSSLTTSSSRRLLPDRTSAVFAPSASDPGRGHLLFVREDRLFAQSFDSRSLELSGEPVVVAEDVSFTSTPPQIAATVDLAGTLAYVSNGRPPRRLVWYDRTGKELETLAMLANVPGGIALAPGGQRVAFTRRLDGRVSLFSLDLERNQEIRLSSPPRVPIAPVWSPDGQRVAYGSPTEFGWGLFIKTVGGTEQPLHQSAEAKSVSDWSRDDRWLLYAEAGSGNSADIWALSDPLVPHAGRKPVALLATPLTESQAKVSPDGRWLAYTSRDMERHVYLRPFAVPMKDESAWQISTVGGQEPQWRADSKELFYLESITRTRFKLMAVPIGTGPSPAGSPRALFEIQTSAIVEQNNVYIYAPSPDGQRFLFDAFAAGAEPSLELVLNWAR